MKPRAVKLSKTFNDQLVEQIDYGEQRFGARVAEEKKERVLAAIENLLANNPAIKARPARLNSFALDQILIGRALACAAGGRPPARAGPLLKCRNNSAAPAGPVPLGGSAATPQSYSRLRLVF